MKGNEPAFPSKEDMGHGYIPMFHSGLTKREWMAGRAMQGLVHHAFTFMMESDEPNVASNAARQVIAEIPTVAYAIADAMLEEANG